MLHGEPKAFAEQQLENCSEEQRLIACKELAMVCSFNGDQGVPGHERSGGVRANDCVNATGRTHTSRTTMFWCHQSEAGVTNCKLR